MNLIPPTLEQLRELAPGHLFETLDAGERTRFAHALRSPEFGAALQAELAALQTATGALAASQAITPPTGLRDRLQARIAAEQSASASSTPLPVAPMTEGTPFAPVARVSRATPTSKAVRVTALGNPPVLRGNAPGLLRNGGTRRAGWYAAAVASAGLAAALVFAFDLRGRVDALQAAAREKSLLLARSDEKRKATEQTLATLLAGRGNVVLVNLNTTVSTGPGMQVFWNVRSGKAVVNAFGLAQVAKDRAYMLWMIRDGTPVPLKLFTPDEGGRALVANVGVPTSTTGITLLAVTEENALGAAAMMVTPGPSTRRAHRQRRCARRVRDCPRVVWLDHETARLPEALRRYDGGYVTRPRG